MASAWISTSRYVAPPGSVAGTAAPHPLGSAAGRRRFRPGRPGTFHGKLPDVRLTFLGNIDVDELGIRRLRRCTYHNFRVYVYIYIYTIIHMYICRHACMYKCIYVSINVYRYTHMKRGICVCM